MDENKKKYPVGIMANLLNVSKSGYYEWRVRVESRRSKENTRLISKIKEIYKKSKSRYGSPKIYKDLIKEGEKCGKNRVVRLMRLENIRSIVKKKFRITTNSKHNNPVSENILERKFYVSKPNKVWVSDITYIWTENGWLYLCVIIDLFSRKVIGYSFSENLKSDIVIKAFLMAWNQRSPEEGLVFHSDRGVQYSCDDFQKILKEKKVICSMSRKGNCWDNACAESFFHLLKTEEVNHKKYESKEVAKIKIFEYIEVFYNNFRTHSYLNYMSPTEFETKKTA